MHNEELVDQLDLVINGKCPLGKVTQETAREHHKLACILAQQALNAPFEVFGSRFRTPRLELETVARSNLLVFCHCHLQAWESPLQRGWHVSSP